EWIKFRGAGQHDPLSPSAYRDRLRPTWAAGNGSLLFRIRLCLRALRPAGAPSTPEASCIPPVLADAVCCLRRDMSGSATSPFRGLMSRGCKVHFMLGPQICFLSREPYSSRKAFDVPLRRRG